MTEVATRRNGTSSGDFSEVPLNHSSSSSSKRSSRNNTSIMKTSNAMTTTNSSSTMGSSSSPHIQMQPRSRSTSSTSLSGGTGTGTRSSQPSPKPSASARPGFLSGLPARQTAYSRLKDSHGSDCDDGALHTRSPRYTDEDIRHPSASMPISGDTYVDELAYSEYLSSDESEALFLRRIIMALVVLLVGILIAFIVRVVHEGNRTSFVTRFADYSWIDTDSEMSFFHLSDIHFDSFYNSTVTSSNGVMCRSELINSAEDVPPVPRSRFGRQACDPPLDLLRTVLARMHNVNPNPPFILLGGDMVGHNLGAMNLTNSTKFFLDDTQKVFDEISAVFPGVPILPTFGNNDGPVHDGEPLDDGPFILALSEMYTKAIKPNQHRQCDLTNLEHALFYSCEVLPKLFVISLNTMVWFKRESVTDQIERLAALEYEWLEQELHRIFDEDPTRRAIVIAHVPPAVSTFDGKAGLFEDDIARLASIFAGYRDGLSGAFLAHWHTDEFQVMFGANGTEERVAALPMFLNPSVSPIHDKTNPGFREYAMRKIDLQLMNYRQHILDIDKLNLLERFGHLNSTTMEEEEDDRNAADAKQRRESYRRRDSYRRRESSRRRELASIVFDDGDLDDFSSFGLWTSYHFREEYQANNGSASLSLPDFQAALENIARSVTLSQKYDARQKGGYISIEDRLRFTGCSFFHSDTPETYEECRADERLLLFDVE